MDFIADELKISSNAKSRVTEENANSYNSWNDIIEVKKCTDNTAEN